MKRITECRITFRQPKEATPGYNLVVLVGDLHNRSTCRNPMKRLQSADYTVALKLQLEKEYKFRYLID